MKLTDGDIVLVRIALRMAMRALNTEGLNDDVPLREEMEALLNKIAPEIAKEAKRRRAAVERVATAS